MNTRRLLAWLVGVGVAVVLLTVGVGVLLLRRSAHGPSGQPPDPIRASATNTALPTSRGELAELGHAAGHDGDWRMAFECFRKVVQAGNATESEWLWATGAALGAGETNECVRFSRQMLDQLGQQDNPVTAERCAKQCLSLPALPADLLDRAAARADFASSANSNLRWRQLAKGMAEYRRGRWSESLAALRQPERTSEIEISVQAWAFSAMARHRLGDADGARKALAEANRRVQVMVRTGELGNPRNNTWDNCARAIAARAEAEQLIFGRPVSAPLDPAIVRQNRQTWSQVLQAIAVAEQLARLEQWPEASEGFASVLQHPAFHWEHLELTDSILAQKMAVAFLLADNRVRHHQLSTNLLERSASSLTATVQERYASAILAGTKPLTPGLTERAVALGRRAFEEPGADRNPWRLLLRGMTGYRTGNYEEIVPVLARAEFPGDAVARGRALAFRALALLRLGRTNEASQCWADAEAARQSARGAGWWNLGAYELAAREYQALTNAPAN